MYARFVFDHQPLKVEEWCVHCVVGGDRLIYHINPMLSAASLLETKPMVSSTRSEAKFGARFFSVNLKDYFLASPMKNPEFMKIPITLFPPDIITPYNLLDIIDNNCIYIKIKVGNNSVQKTSKSPSTIWLRPSPFLEKFARRKVIQEL